MISKEKIYNFKKQKIKKEITAAKRILRKGVEPLEVADKFIHDLVESKKEKLLKKDPTLSEEEIYKEIRKLSLIENRIKSQRKRRLRMGEIKEILSRLTSIFTNLELKYLIVGGIAVIHYGHIRTTQVIDLIIQFDRSNFSNFLELLEQYNFDVMRDQCKLAFEEGTNFTIFDNKSYLRLDVKVAIEKEEKDVLNSGIQQNIMGNELLIAPIEYVLFGKILYLGEIEDVPKEELLLFQDAIDFLTLFHAHKDKIDLDLLEEKVKEYDLESTFNKLLSIQL